MVTEHTISDHARSRPHFRQALVTQAAIIWSGDHSLHIRVGEGDDDTLAAGVVRIELAVREAGLAGVSDITPGSCTVQIDFQPGSVETDAFEASLREIALGALTQAAAGTRPRCLCIPVCYDTEFGPDLDAVAQAAGIDRERAASMHASGEYTVRFLGFSPGFAYLAGLPKPLHAPRLEKPRARVPAGSVGIAGGRTGIYPHASPGGWRVIGATPLRMFDPDRNPPALLQAGDRVRFERISRPEFERLRASIAGAEENR